MKKVISYSEVRKYLIKNKVSDIKADIVSCVNASLYNPVTDNVFNALCRYVYSVWDNVDKSYTQLIADIVVDCYQDCGYGYKDKCSLTLHDIRHCNHIDKIIDIFTDKYWECC